MNYILSKGHYGECGEIPIIQLDSKDELLPVNKLRFICVTSLSDDIVNSTILLQWIIQKEESEINAVIKTTLQISDQRLKKQLKKNPDMTEKLIDLLVNCLKKKESGKYLQISGKLLESELPEKIKPIVRQIWIWEDFIKQVSDVTHVRYGTQISERYFKVVMSRLAFKIPRNEEDVLESESMIASEFGAIFDFDPKKWPLSVGDECAWWEFPKKKIVIILPHDSADPEFADYYNYREMYEQFLSDKEKKRVEEKENSKRFAEWWEKDKEKEEEEKDKKKKELYDTLLL